VAGRCCAAVAHRAESGVDGVGGPVNINTADVKELMKLEGVVAAWPRRSSSTRDSHGPFKKPEELRKVEGIGSGLWEKNRTRIVIK